MTFAENPNNVIRNPSTPVLNCGATITKGDGGSTNLFELFGCTGANAAVAGESEAGLSIRL